MKLRLTDHLIIKIDMVFSATKALLYYNFENCKLTKLDQEIGLLFYFVCDRRQATKEMI
jgi:hypothetical protein